jgi:hypothetical protein
MKKKRYESESIGESESMPMSPAVSMSVVL